MTEHDNEDTFDNEIEEQEVEDQHKGFEEDPIAKSLREVHEQQQDRRTKEYEESLDLEEKDDNSALDDEKDASVLNKVEVEEVKVGEEAPADTSERSSDDYPATWKGEFKDKWEALDPAIKAEVHRREGDMLKGLEQYRDYANYAQDVAKTFEPYNAEIKAAGTNQKQVLEAALNTMYILRSGSPTDKANELLALAQAYGVQLNDVNSVNEQYEAGMPLIDPAVEELKRENQQILGFLQQSNREKQQAEVATYASELDKFADDPENKYFDDVREEMARIFGSSQEELSLQEVYDNAVWANPVTREKLIVERRDTERRDAAEKAAGAKRTAKTNVASKGQPLSNATTNGTLESEIDDVWAAIKSRR